MIARLRQMHPLALIVLLGVIGILFWMMAVLAARGSAGSLFWIGAAVLWMLAWIANDALAHSETATTSLARLRDFVVPAVFGITLLFLWQLIVKGFGIPAVLLPAPSDIWTKLIASLPILKNDFIQTFLRAVLPGWAIGSLAGFLVAVACDAWGS